MAPFEELTQVFIVRLWCERREIAYASSEWRGVIEHIPSGKRRYLTNLDTIPAFITPYLSQSSTERSEDNGDPNSSTPT